MRSLIYAGLALSIVLVGCQPNPGEPVDGSGTTGAGTPSGPGSPAGGGTGTPGGGTGVGGGINARPGSGATIPEVGEPVSVQVVSDSKADANVTIEFSILGVVVRRTVLQCPAFAVLDPIGPDLAAVVRISGTYAPTGPSTQRTALQQGGANGSPQGRAFPTALLILNQDFVANDLIEYTVPDPDDGCPNDPGKTAPGICDCGTPDTDSDGDGTPDCVDLCPGDPAKIDPGQCGCGAADTDSDGDSAADCRDECPNDPNKIVRGLCACGVSDDVDPDSDRDGDGTPDCDDNCPDDPEKIDPGLCGCGEPDVDSDNDGVFDCNDECPEDPDKIEPGLCGCGVADDTDPASDRDGDGVPDCQDNCPDDPAKTDPGACGCGAADTDSNRNGVPDCQDSSEPPPGGGGGGGGGGLADCNGNSVADVTDIANGTSLDRNVNGIPDECEGQTLYLLPDAPLVGVGRSINATVGLFRPAPPAGVEVDLDSDTTNVAGIDPPTVFILGGETEAAATVTGFSEGTATLTATPVGAAGLTPFSTGITVTDALISLASGVEVAPGKSASMAVSLTKPAGPGGVTVELESADPGIATITPSVFIPEGFQVPGANPQLGGVTIGVTQITASADGFAPDTKDVTVTVHLSFQPSSVTIVEGQSADLRLRLSAAVEGLVLDLSVDDTGVASTQSTVAAETCETCVEPTVGGVSLGSTVLRASAPGVSEATATVSVISTPMISISDLSVGDDLQASLTSSSTRRLGAAAPAGGVSVTLTSQDPAKLLLSTDPTQPGSAQIVLPVPAGSVQIPIFYVYGLSDGALAPSVDVLATAPGYLDDVFTVTLYPSGFYISSPGNFTTTPLSGPTSISIRSARLNPGTLSVVQIQPIRGGLGPIDVDVNSSNTSVGDIFFTPVTFSPNVNSVFTEFDPFSTGTTDITISTPSGFDTPATGQQITATVGEPEIFIFDLSVGDDLQTSHYYWNRQLEAPAPVGGVDVTVISQDPARVLLSTDQGAPGLGTIILNVPEGDYQIPEFFVQGLDDGVQIPQQVLVDVTAPGYQPSGFFVELDPSGFSLNTSSFSTTTLSGITTISLYSYRLSPGSLSLAEAQGLSGGATSVSVDVTSSDPAVGTITTSPVVFDPGGQFLTTGFDPLSLGTTNIALVTPTGFDTPATNQQITATVGEPAINITSNVNVGDDLQTSLYYYQRQLTAPAPVGGVDVTFTSQDPTRVVLAANAADAGSESILAHVPEGSTQIPEFFIQGLDDGVADNSPVQIDAAAPGYTGDSFNASLFPSGFYISPSGISTTTFSANSSVTVRPVRLFHNTLTFAESGGTRGGLPPVSINVTSSNPTVGTITASPVVFNGNLFAVSTAFDPQTAGSSVISINTPAGFETPSNLNQQITATVGAPDVYFSTSSTIVGVDLQQSVNVFLEAAPPSPVNVVITSCSGDVATVSSVAALSGGTTVTFPSVTSTFAGTIYVQGRSLGCMTLEAQAPGYNDGILNVTVDPAGFYMTFPSSDFSLEEGSGDFSIQLRSARLDLTTLNTQQIQPVRGGLSVNVAVTSSTPAVGPITTSPVLFGPNVSFMQTFFSPLTPGTTTIQVGTPPGFSTPSNGQRVVGTVTPAP